MAAGLVLEVFEVCVVELQRAIERVAAVGRIEAHVPAPLHLTVPRRHRREGHRGALGVRELDHDHSHLLIGGQAGRVGGSRVVRPGPVHVGPHGNVVVVRALVPVRGQTIVRGILRHLDGLAGRPADVWWVVPVDFEKPACAVELHGLGSLSELCLMLAHVEVEDPNPHIVHINCLVVNFHKADLGI